MNLFKNQTRLFGIILFLNILIVTLVNKHSIPAETSKDSFGKNIINEIPNNAEPEFQIVTEYICHNEHCYKEKCKDGKCIICGDELTEVTHVKKFARRERVSEKIAKLLEKITKERFDFAISGTGIMQQILNGSERRGFSAEGSLDTIFLYRPFDYSTLFLDLESIGGNGPDEYIGSISGLNDDAGSFLDTNGNDRLSVREAWLELKLFAQKMSLVIGKIDMTNYFDSNAIANDETTQFITSAFVNNLVLEVPKNGLGAVSSYELNNGVYFRLGLQSTDGAELDIIDALYGMGEVGIKSKILFGLDGNYRLWAKFNGDQNDNKGVGISIDQQIAKHVFAFVRYGINQTDGATVKNAESAGLELHHPFHSRMKDSAAIAFGHATTVDNDEESAVELYYRFVINDHIAITPSFQTVFNPVSIENNEIATIAGIRTQIEF